MMLDDTKMAANAQRKMRAALPLEQGGSSSSQGGLPGEESLQIALGQTVQPPSQI